MSISDISSTGAMMQMKRGKHYISRKYFYIFHWSTSSGSVITNLADIIVGNITALYETLTALHMDLQRFRIG